MTTLNADDIPNASEKVKKAIADINNAFDEMQLMIDSAQYWADFAKGKPPTVNKQQSHGITHGSEYVFDRKDSWTGAYNPNNPIILLDNSNVSRNENGSLIIHVNNY